jgi:hypothetical protein
MTNSTTPNSGGRKFLPLVLILVALVVAFVLLRSCRKPVPSTTEPGITPPPVAVASPTQREPTVTAVMAPSPTTQGCGALPDPLPPCKDWLVTVGPDPATLTADGKSAEWICLRSNNVVRWRMAEGSTGLKIFFPTSGFPQGVEKSVSPFGYMTRIQIPANGPTPAKDEWVFNNVSLPIFSGQPNSALGSGQKCFKYWQTINGQTADGRIIIQR